MKKYKIEPLPDSIVDDDDFDFENTYDLIMSKRREIFDNFLTDVFERLDFNFENTNKEKFLEYLEKEKIIIKENFIYEKQIILYGVVKKNKTLASLKMSAGHRFIKKNNNVIECVIDYEKEFYI